MNEQSNVCSWNDVLIQEETKYNFNSVTFLPVKSSRAQVTAVGHVVALSLGADDCVVLILNDDGNVRSTMHLPGVQCLVLLS